MQTPPTQLEHYRQSRSTLQPSARRTKANKTYNIVAIERAAVVALVITAASTFFANVINSAGLGIAGEDSGARVDGSACDKSGGYEGKEAEEDGRVGDHIDGRGMRLVEIGCWF